MATKKTNSHTSTRKKASASLSSSPRSKKAASKTAKLRKSKTAKEKAEELARQKRLKKLEKLTLKIFRWAYESNQRGEFQRL